jgi:hypothetical protein
MKKHALLKLTLVLILLISAFSFTACQKTEVSQENTLEIKNVYQDPIGNVHLVLESVDVFDSTKGKDLEIKFGENDWEGYYYGLDSKDLVIKSYYDDNLNNLISQAGTLIKIIFISQAIPYLKAILIKSNKALHLLMNLLTLI